MKKYIQLCDTPRHKKGEVFVECRNNPNCIISEDNSCVYQIDTIQDFDCWFAPYEDIPNYGWKPEPDSEVFTVSSLGTIYDASCLENDNRINMGLLFKTRTEAELYRDMNLARVKLRNITNFKPDWNNHTQTKFIIIYDHQKQDYRIDSYYYLQYNIDGVYYRSEAEARYVLRYCFKELETVRKYYENLNNS